MKPEDKRLLSDSEALALTTILVRDNESMTHISFSSGTYGVGNTNNSGYVRDSEWTKSISELSGKPILSTGAGIDIVAAVEDLLYVVHEGKLKRLHIDESVSTSRGIAYDTYQMYTLCPTSDKQAVITTELGVFRGPTVKGLPEGKGRYDFNGNDPLGRVHAEGLFIAGEMQRLCIIVFRDGSWYEGWMKDGLFEEKGTYYYPNGDHYKGYFQKGKMHGSGVLFDANGKVKHNGWWKEGNIVK